MEALVKISSLFDVAYGVNLELVHLEECESSDPNAIRFVSRSKENNGVSAYVKKVSHLIPNNKNTISVAGGGTYVLSAFVQIHEYYSGRDVYILTPRKAMTELELLYYCLCISNNRYRYNYGRQANKTLKDILIPNSIPNQFKGFKSKDFNQFKRGSLIKKELQLDCDKWKWYDISPTLFTISASRDELIDHLTVGGSTPYITSSEFNNGVLNYVHETPANKGNTITANRGGSVGHFFYQPFDYLATPVDVRILTPKFKMNKYIGIFLVVILGMEKYRFNYSRKMGSDRLAGVKIKLPSKNGKPDFDFMENYIKALPYSEGI